MVEMSKCLLNLVAEFQGGDIQAFPLIYSDFEKLIDYYSEKLGDEDAFQEFNVFFLELLYGIDLCRFVKLPEEAFRRYIAVCIRNKYIYLSKQKSKSRELIPILSHYNALWSNFEDDTIIAENLLEKLPMKQRRVMTYRYIYKYSDSEIAKALNISRQAVCKLRNRAINNLREYL